MANVNQRFTPAIYALHTGDHNYSYVGSTSRNSDNRLYQHISRAQHGHMAPVYVWMRDVGIRNVQVIDLELVADKQVRQTHEAEWIARLISEGYPLTNELARNGVADSLSEELKKRMSETRKGKPTWITGKQGEEAGWTEARRLAVALTAAQVRADRIPVHGTLNEYKKHGCRCSECFAASRTPRVPVAEHGRYLYKRDKCRCEICVTANREYGRNWLAARQ
jgi:hypothetical protein